MRDLIGLCVSCRHWQTNSHDWHRPMDEEDDSGPDRTDETWGVCRLTEVGLGPTNRMTYTYADSKALARGDDLSDHELITRPDFGCVQWEQG